MYQKVPDKIFPLVSPWLLEAPVRKIVLQRHTPACTSQCWSRQTQHGLAVRIWMHLVNGTGNSPSPGQPSLGVVKQDKSSRGSVDTTKTRSGPQRVRMSSGERPTGAKGKQSDTEALCQPPPPSTPPPFRREKANVPAQRSGEPFFQQKRFPGPRISVPGRKHTFLLVVL